MPVRLAHFTDLHLPIRQAPRLREILNKRALGYLSWLKRRRHWHRPEVAERLAADMRSQGADAALVSGDLVNIALPAEFDDAVLWLERSLKPIRVLFAPGNHDTYVRESWEATLGKLGASMRGVRTSDPRPRAPHDFEDFPFVAAPDDSDLAVIVANSSPPTAPGLASGALGAGQIRRIEDELAAAGARRRFRILMLHHPINDGVVSRRKALSDRAALLAAIGRAGVELVLHGHAHVPHFGDVVTPRGAAPVIGGGSASHPRAGGAFRPGRYNLLTIDGDGGDWTLMVMVREFDPSGEVRTVETRQFRIGGASRAA